MTLLHFPFHFKGQSFEAELISNSTDAIIILLDESLFISFGRIRCNLTNYTFTSLKTDVPNDYPELVESIKMGIINTILEREK
jgi:hypothetical protein